VVSLLDVKAGMFRDGRERDRILVDDHLLALYGGDVIGGHLEALGDTDNLFVFDLKFVKQFPQGDARAFGFHFVNRQVSVWAEITVNKVGPVIRLVCDVKSRK